LARALAQFVAADLGQPVIVDNRAGAGGMIGSAEVARAPADGYTLLFNTSSLVQSQAVAQQKLYNRRSTRWKSSSLMREAGSSPTRLSAPARQAMPFNSFSPTTTSSTWCMSPTKEKRRC
jgi:tripartite-type tricarboxylate transporter receptor subunit TctC